MRIIKLTKNKETIVDDEVYTALNQWRWYATTLGYAYRSVYIGNRRKIAAALHHCVIGYPLNGLEVDHINRNTLDNRLINLRIVDRKQNMNNIGIRADNKSGYRGIHWNKEKQRWTVQYQHKHVGHFNDLNKAIEFQSQYIYVHQ